MEIDFISPIREELDKAMHAHCVLFTTVGTPSETPRYFNFDRFDEESRLLYIKSSCCALGFNIKVPEDYPSTFGEVDNFWQQFKEYRTKFLIENYPTIKTV